MKVRKTKSVTLDEVLLAEIRGAILHPELHLAVLNELEELERKGKLCRMPSTILETYNITMDQRIALFEESCRKRNIVIEYYLNQNR